MRKLAPRAALLLAACATGVPVERQVVVAGDRFNAVQGEAALLSCAPSSPTRAASGSEVVGATCDIVSSLYSRRAGHPVAQLVVPNFGPQSPELDRHLPRRRALRRRPGQHRHPLAAARRASGGLPAIPSGRATPSPGAGTALPTRYRTTLTSRSRCARPGSKAGFQVHALCMRCAWIVHQKSTAIDSTPRAPS